MKTLYTKKSGEFEDTPNNNVNAKRISEADYYVGSDIAIYEDRIRIASFGNKPHGIIIHDKEAAKTLASLFRLAWDNYKSGLK